MTTADLPMLLPPDMVPEPGTLSVSTFAKPEYAKLTFTYGKVKSGGTWPVHCKWFKVRIPTGRQASALTSEPGLIHYELTVPDGKRQWAVERDTRDPNQTIFTCSPPPGDPAAFDGTWSVELELWGIEVNGGVGPVDIVWEESTSTAGAAGPFEERTGRGEVAKRDDSFYLHSFRPATVAIARNTKATLHWDGTPHATYTMYYRKPDGTQGSSPASDDSWTSPVALVDDSSFTLEAKMGNEVRYLTTHIKVNNPDIAVTSVAAPTATGTIAVKNNLTVETGKTLTVRVLSSGDQAVPIQFHTPIVGRPGSTYLRVAERIDLEGGATVAAGKTLTVNGSTQLNGGATVAAGKTLTTNGSVQANGNVTVAAAAMLTTNGPVQANGNVTVAAAGTLTTNGPVQANNNVTIKSDKTLKVTLVHPAIDNGVINLQGNVAVAAGKNVTIPKGGGQLVVTDAFVAKSHNPGSTYPKVEIGMAGVATDGSIKLQGTITRGGRAVVAAGDTVALQSLYWSGKYLNGSGKDNHSDNAGVTGPAAFYRSHDGAANFKIEHR